MSIRLRRLIMLAKRRYWYTNKIRNPRGEGGTVGTVGVTNKCTGYNAAPPALVAMGTAAAFNSAVTNMSVSGGDGSTLFGVVDDTAALQAIAATDPFIAAGLANGWLNGRVYDVDNSGGASTAFVASGGTTGNTNPATISTYSRVLFDGGNHVGIIVTGSAAQNVPSTSDYSRTIQTVTPVGASSGFSVVIRSGTRVRFILFDLIEAASAAPVPTVVAGASATGALPTNVRISNGLTNGLSLSFLGQSTVNGLPAYRIRFQGTAINTTAMFIGTDTNTYASAVAGQAWGADWGVKLAAGAMNGASVNSVISEYVGASFLRTAQTGAAVTPNGTMQRVQSSAVLTSPTLNAASHFFRIAMTALTVYDFTLDFVSAKLVQIATIEGPELVTNGDFASATGWTLAPAASIGSGVLTTSSPTQFSLFASTSFTAQPSGSVLKSKIDVVTVTSGDIRQFLGGGSDLTGAYISSVGTKTDYVVSTGTQTVYSLQAHVSNVVMTFDNASLRLVTPGYLPTFPILPPVGVPGDSSALLS